MYEEIPVVVIETIISFTWKPSMSDALKFSYYMIEAAKRGEVEIIRSYIEDGVAPIGIDYDGNMFPLLRVVICFDFFFHINLFSTFFVSK